MAAVGSSGRRAARTLIVCLLLCACVGGGGTSSSPPTDAQGTTSAPASRPAASPPPDAAPPELAGRWRRNLLGETVILTLDGTGYHIQRGPESGNGSISVDGDEVQFFGSNLCDGRGTYRWSFEDGRLRLTEIVPDPCDGRTDVLLRGTFGRVDD